jgi:hypothetical protein
MPLPVRPSTASANLSQPSWLCLCKVVEFRRLQFSNGATSHVQGLQTGTVRHRQSLVADVDVDASPPDPSQNRRDGCVLPSSFSPVFRVTQEIELCKHLRSRATTKSTKRLYVRAFEKQCAMAIRSGVSSRHFLRAGMHSNFTRCSRMIRALSHAIHSGERPHARNQLALHLPSQPSN